MNLDLSNEYTNFRKVGIIGGGGLNETVDFQGRKKYVWLTGCSKTFSALLAAVNEEVEKKIRGAILSKMLIFRLER